MKLFINTTIIFSVLLAINSSGFYDLQFESIDGAMVNTSSFKGKKVVIAVVSSEQKSVRLIEYLDSTQKANDSVRVIAIPTGDFKGTVNVQTLKELRNRLSIIISKPMKVTKESGAQQHALFSWLTKSAENTHFNMDVSGEGQLFFISAKGTLFGVFPKDTPARIISRTINQSFTE